MGRPKPPFMPPPRIWTIYQTATRLGMGEQKFRDLRPVLEKAGFPIPDDLLGGYDADAIEAWLDRRSGIGARSLKDQEGEALRIIHGGR